MKIIFLDFDGVMDTARYELMLRISGHPSVDTYGTVFDPECVWNLKQIIGKTGAKIVVSSSWKDLLSFEELLDMWEIRGLPGEVIGTTPYTLECRNRGDEIDLWLKECDEECQYVILDDIDAGNFNEHQQERLVVVDPVQGLNEESVEKAVKILNDGKSGLLKRLKEKRAYRKKYRRLRKEANDAYCEAQSAFAKQYFESEKQGTCIDWFVNPENYIQNYVAERWNDDERQKRNYK